MKLFRPVLALALLLACAFPQARAQLELKSHLGSAFIVPGEETELWLSLESETGPDGRPEAPRAENLTIRFLGDPVYPLRGRGQQYVYKFSVRSYTEGTHIIPPFQLTMRGQPIQSQPVTLHVTPLPQTAWQTNRVEDLDLRYAATIFTPHRVPYEGETFQSEVKVYLPTEIKVAESSIAELEHDGIVAWRFEASKEPYTRDVFQTNVRIDGQDYHGVSYRSTATPIRSSAVSLGPGHARLKLHIQTLNRGIIRRIPVSTRLPIPKRIIQTRPLPPNPPPGFTKAVGRFTLTAQADTDDLEESDPISLLLSVSGVGNLDTLDAPEIIADEADWKVYPPGRLQRQGERRDVSGVVTFSQIIRPRGDQRVVPPFRLVVFDPESEQYNTLTTPPIPFDVKSPLRTSSAPATILPDAKTPVAEMEGILGIIEPTSRQLSRPSGWSKSWHLVPVLLALYLLFRIAQRYLLPRLRKPALRQDVLQALASVEEAGPGASDFLRAAGRFIESWIPGRTRDEQVESVLQRRDLDCYRPDANEQTLPAGERGRILRHLRERALAALPLLLFLAIFLIPRPAHADTAPAATDVLYRQAAAAWSEGSYHAAIDLYRSAHPTGDFPADVNYNLGNCYFQLGERGLAALHYQRALAQVPRHPEARQNLTFLKRKTGAITVLRPMHEVWLAKFDRSVFSTLLAVGLWCSALAGLGLFATLSKSFRPAIWIGLSAGPLVAVTAGVGLYHYPSDAEFAPLNEQAVVITANDTVARTEAGIDAAEVIAVPPGSICRPIARRGPWTYVELADKTRGWLPSAEIRMIVADPIRDPVPAPKLGA